MKRGKPKIIYKECMACGICVVACPFSCLELTKLDIDKYKKAYPELTMPDKCTGCGLCAKACPVETIEITA